MDIVYHDLNRMLEVKEFIQQWDDSLNYVEVNTSGSTGKPRTLQLSKSLLAKSAERTITHFNLSPGTKAGLCLSLSSIAGKMMVVRSLLANMELHVLPVNKNPLKDLEMALDFNALVPVQAMNYLDQAQPLSQQGVVLIGGAPLNERQFQRISQYFSQAYQTYGMTETASHVAVRKISHNFKEPYQALEGVTLSVKEDCLVIHCKEFENGFIQTNDCVQLVGEEAFHLLGRRDFVINSGGIKIHPESVEDRLSTLLNEPCLAMPIPDEVWGESVGIVLLKTGKIPTLAELKKLYTSNEMPRKFALVDKMITTKTGKIDRPKMHQTLKKHEWQALL